MVKMKKCPGCKRELELNADNFHRNRSSRIGFTSRCKECLREESRIAHEKVKIERKERAEIRDMELKHAEEFKIALRDLNCRNHRPVPINKNCTVKRLEGLVTTSIGGRYLRGRFIEVYDSHLVFETEQGWKECFRKNDLEISWTVKHKGQRKKIS